MRRRLTVGFFLAAFTSFAFICANADEVDNYVIARMRTLHIPGVSLAIVRNGRLIKAAGYGFADLQLRVPATKATVYEIGSNTKQFTAAAVMLLVEEGKIGLDDSVTKYFPEAPQTWKSITVRNLLTHTSGIQNHVAVPGYLRNFKIDLFFEGTPSPDELLKMFFQLPQEFLPGETWAYDNSGYILLGHIIEKASGRPYWQFMQDRIFKPLGMTATRSTDPRPLIPNRASGYEWMNDSFENRAVLYPFVAFSAGSILSDVEDMARWDAALYTDKLLKRSSRDQIWTPAKGNNGETLPFNYGFGWFIDSYHGHRLVQHSGGTPGFSSAIYRFIDDRLTVIVLTNHSDRIVDPFAIDIAGMIIPSLKRPAQKIDPDPKTSLRLHDVFANLLNGKHDPALFTQPMNRFMNTATGKAFGEWFASHGVLKSFTFSDHENTSSGQTYRYKIQLGNGSYWFTMDVAADGKISQVYWW